MEMCPKCFRLTDKGIITLNDGPAAVWRSCWECWNAYLSGNPIARTLWSILQTGNQANKPQEIKPVEEMLKESNDNMTAKIASRIVAYANHLNRPEITVAEVIAHERDALAKQRRGQMAVVKIDDARVEREAKEPEADGNKEADVENGQDENEPDNGSSPS